MSSSTGIYCVDVRKLFKSDGQETRQGLAFRIREWASMKKIIATNYSDDHLNQLGVANSTPSSSEMSARTV